ncbi:MAG TPA: M3 family metallopeptidase [Kiritimatiellia bacterium]|jgi:oligopeptidase A|nr:M3 family metallopeptidase [Kiritimatiellia bacterium]HOM58723.1 M3 family metallopeptidase [Kiritimatiellia bacterium]HOR97269.1 M3 family metallopeptidase [Kiritimatiellia bacterium]HPK36744.1 M3 family metallopeptidase [Kiritimatiellia bacterium]HPW74661.1 M3 family metallopeptidase [Kiritimatiellia bacterium]
MSAFLHIPYLPPFDRLTPEAAASDFPHLLADAHAAVTKVEQALTPSWEGLMRPLYDACRPLFDAWGLLSHMLSVMNSDAWRQVQERLQPEIIAFSQRVAQSPLLYRGYLALREADRASPCLTPVRRRILVKTIQAVEHAGVGLDAERQTRFNAIQNELAQLATAFRNHVLDATRAFALTLRTPEEAAGLPPALREVTAQAARAAGEPDATAATGPWRITLDTAVYLPFMMHSRNRTAREQLCRAYATRAASGPTDNTLKIERLLALRRELAGLLGFESYAELNLADKTARSVAAVDTLIARLAEAAGEAARTESEELLTFARSHGFDEGALQPWDIAFWSERQREHLYDYSDEELSRYFLFPRVLEGLFSLANRLFGIVITPADGEAPVWHPDVRFFRVADADGTPLACFFLDPYSRPETKSGGAWMNDFRTRDRAPDGTVTLPMALLVCNQSVPVGNQPPVMRFQEVGTLFHEFGHALQHMLTTVEEPGASGLNGIEWDAIEIVSQFMENWCYDRATLKGLSRHAETGDPLPDALFDRLIAAKNHRAASAMMRQLFFAATDMDLYARYPRPEWPDADTVKRLNAARYSPTPLLPEDRFLCSFSHIFAGGYAAGYYSYKWSEVFSADAFAAFEEAGLAQGDAVRAMGRRFRDSLLALGGGTDPAEVFRLFRGRDPSIEPLLRHNGLLRAELRNPAPPAS